MKWFPSISLASLVLALAVPSFADAPKEPRQVDETHAAGAVSRYVVSPTGHVRGFVLGDQIVVMLPPREGDAMAKELPVGQTVQVDARARREQPHVLFHAAVSGPHGVLASPPPPREHKPIDKAERERRHQEMKEALAKLPEQSVQGTVKTVLTDGRGTARTILLSNGASIFLEPSLARTLGNRAIRPGETLTASGHGAAYPLGVSVEASELSFPDGARVQSR